MRRLKGGARGCAEQCPYLEQLPIPSYLHLAALTTSAGGFTGDTIALHSTSRETFLHRRLLLRFSNAFQTGAAPIPFMAARSRLPDTAVSGFNRLKVVAGPAIIVEGISDDAGARGRRGSSPHDHPSSVHATTLPFRASNRWRRGHRRGFLLSWFSASDLMLGYWILRR
ncbi:hypothetical protein DEO72_LG3g784 [Vigna unguiculata]|uniref:Uncharacterized protein n=1 Tax=Vigna unguiculata TaxID=3917 RepID=A0A4D6LCP1_VIGUN|nr:hypothetical protein DEO72_LG3g784 [Vigna unguiculata]